MSQAQRLRIAIAVTALRHKPAEQSYDAYVLDLRANFPPSGVAQSDDIAESWRARAVRLEKQLHEIEEKYEKEQIELVALRAAKNANAHPTTPIVTATKKKSKKRTQQADGSKERSSSATNEETLMLVSPLSAVNDSGNLFSMLHILDALVAAHSKTSSPSETEVLYAAATRVLDASSRVLSALLSPAPTSTSGPGVIDAISTMLTRVLAAVLPMLATATAKSMKKAPLTTNYADDFLGRLLSCILIPALRSFTPLTRQHLSTLFGRPKDSKRPPTGSPRSTNDLRPPVLALLRTVIDACHSTISTPSTEKLLGPAVLAVQSSLALEGARELERLYPNAGRPSDVGEASAPSPLVPPDRLVGLVRKDAAWYVCSAVRLTVPGTRGSGEGEVERLLNEGVCTALAGVLRGMSASMRRPGGDHASGDGAKVCGAGCANGRRAEPSEIERGMVMAVAEAVWLSQG